MHNDAIVVGQQVWHIDTLRVVYLAELETGSGCQPRNILLASTTVNQELSGQKLRFPYFAKHLHLISN